VTVPEEHVTQLITVKQIGFEGLSEDVDGDGWVVKECVPRRWARWAERPRTQRGGRRTRDEQFVLISRTQLCAAGHDGKWCTESGELRWIVFTCVVSWLIGNCRDEPLTRRRKSYNR